MEAVIVMIAVLLVVAGAVRAAALFESGLLHTMQQGLRAGASHSGMRSVLAASTTKVQP